MDEDSSGLVDFQEFQQWWLQFQRTNKAAKRISSDAQADMASIEFKVFLNRVSSYATITMAYDCTPHVTLYSMGLVTTFAHWPVMG